jgi:uncharacterized protein YcfJ
MRVNEFRPGWRLIALGIFLQAFGASCLGIAGAIVGDYFGLWGGRERAAVAWLWAGGFLLAGVLLAVGGTALVRKVERRRR